jgi:hypothetical protein
MEAHGVVPPPPVGDSTNVASRIAGLSVLKGLLLYGASLAFAGFYAYFMEEIVSARAGHAPAFAPALVAAAAALAGVLGSAFALVIGVPTGQGGVNQDLSAEFDKDQQNRRRGVWIWRLLSLEPAGTKQASWPLTAGIWTYAIVASAVAIVYFLHSAETPETIKALAVAFAGYVITLVTTAYGLATKK